MRIQNQYNNSFYGRSRDIKSAWQIMHKIKSEYPASSPYVANYLSSKHNKPISDTNISNERLYVLRKIHKLNINSDLKYSESLLSLVKRTKVMNCKENSELACLIALVNGFKDCVCVDFASKISDGVFADIDHTILLVNQKMPKGKIRLNKFHSDHATQESAFVPSKKSIVVDPIYGIVDYWDNAVYQYQNLELSRNNFYVIAREKLINKEDINELKRKHPELLLNPAYPVK